MTSAGLPAGPSVPDWTPPATYLDRLEVLEERLPVSEAQTVAQARIDAAVAGDLIDFGGLKTALTSPLTVSTADLRLVNFDFTAAGDHRTLLVTGANVLLAKGAVERGSGGAIGDPSGERSNIHVSAAGVRVLDVDPTGASLACIYADNGTTGLTVRGGRFQNTSRKQNACAVMAQLGTSLNSDVTVEAIELSSAWAAPDSVLIYSAARARILSNRIAHLRRLATVTWTSGWTVVSGSVYSHVDRTDGTTRVIRQSGTQRTENTATPTAPGVNEFGASGGLVYLNLGGTDPNTVTITSDILGGYGPTVYANSDAQAMHANLIAYNTVEDVDGFGVYLQLPSIGEGNGTCRNTLRDVCLVGSQHDSLPFAGIGVTKGLYTLLDGDHVKGSGGRGVYVANAGTGRMVGVVVKSSTTEGFRAQTGGWVHDDCESHSNVSHGYTCHTQAGESFTDLEYNNCKSLGNTQRGLNADNTSGTALGVRVNGGTYKNNTSDDVRFHNCNVDSQITGKVATDTDGLIVTGTANARVDQVSNSPKVQTVATDAIFTLTALTSPIETIHTGTLTANRVVTLATSRATPGSRFKITRTGGGAFNLDIGGLKNLATSQWAEVTYNGSAWVLTSFGSL